VDSEERETESQARIADRASTSGELLSRLRGDGTHARKFLRSGGQEATAVVRRRSRAGVSRSQRLCERGWCAAVVSLQAASSVCKRLACSRMAARDARQEEAVLGNVRVLQKP